MIERNEIIKLAKLSKLALTEQEFAVLSSDMQSIVSFAGKINNASACEDALSADDTNVLRDDIVGVSYSKEDILKNAPTSEKGFFVLPRRSE